MGWIQDELDAAAEEWAKIPPEHRPQINRDYWPDE